MQRERTMYIDDQKRMSRLRLFRSPLLFAIIALTGCAMMLLGLIGRPAVPTVVEAPFPSATALHAASLVSDQHIIFFLLLGGFLLMAGGCFILSRRSLRDALKAEAQRKA
jgi:hypothetical protein